MAKQQINQNQITMTPMVSAYRHNGATSTVSGPAVFVMTVALLNVGSAYGVNTTGVFTAPKAGNYWVSFTGFKDSVVNSGALYIRKNGTNVTRTYTSATGYESIAIQLIVPCAAGDTLDIYIGSGVIMHGNESSQLSIIYLGA